MTLTTGLYYLVFFIVAAVTLGAAVLTVSLRNVVHSALALVGTFFGVAGIYLLLEAEFLAVVQVLIYVGAISVLILFAIMLTRGLMQASNRSLNDQWGLAALVSFALFAGMTGIAITGHWPVGTTDITTDLIPQLGKLLVTSYVLPFEVVSVLLLGALVGALVIARD
ncbi:MAG: NADH-quinone oxidoreductase subunit J [Anaerolineae bacterium]